MLYGNIAYLIGGGAPTVLAMIWTILADAVPVARRTSVFYLLHAMTLLLAVLISPISAMLLSINPWIAMWIGFGFLVVGCFASLLVPETLKLRQKADSQQRRRTSIAQDDGAQPIFGATTRKNWLNRAWFTVKNDMGHIWQFVFSSKSILMLMLAMGFSFPVKLNFSQNLLQYMTKRFGWEWSTVGVNKVLRHLVPFMWLIIRFLGNLRLHSQQYNIRSRPAGCATRRIRASCQEIWFRSNQPRFAAGTFLYGIHYRGQFPCRTRRGSVALYPSPRRCQLWEWYYHSLSSAFKCHRRAAHCCYNEHHGFHGRDNRGAGQRSVHGLAPG